MEAETRQKRLDRWIWVTDQFSIYLFGGLRTKLFDCLKLEIGFKTTEESPNRIYSLIYKDTEDQVQWEVFLVKSIH